VRSSPTEAVLDEVNRLHGTSWRYVRTFPGGYQGGAHVLADPPAVLKWMTPPWSASEMRARAALAARAIDAGWPGMRWLATGALADGRPYVVTELAPGEQARVYDARVVDALLAAVDVQAGLAVDAAVAQDWSWYPRSVVFGLSDDTVQRRDVASFSAAGARLVSVVDARCAHLRDLALPRDDLVHGDMGIDNAIVASDGTVRLIDAQQLGRGTRAVDVAAMARHAAYHGAGVVDRLVEAGVAIAGADVFAVCLASVILSVLSFGTWNWPDDVDAAIPPLQALLER
jgi:hypothetical protein